MISCRSGAADELISLLLETSEETESWPETLLWVPEEESSLAEPVLGCESVDRVGAVVVDEDAVFSEEDEVVVLSSEDDFAASDFDDNVDPQEARTREARTKANVFFTVILPVNKFYDMFFFFFAMAN